MMSMEGLSIADIEKKFGFAYLGLNSFESIDDQLDVHNRGLKHLSEGKVSQESLDLGQQYHKEILSSYIPKVSVRFISDDVGHALFAEEEIEVGRYVGEYTGIVRKNDRRYGYPINNYCYEYPIPDEIGRNFVVDATRGCLTRFINHSSDPNLKPFYAFYEGYYHVIFLSIKKISVGDQLLFDYGKSYWYVRGAPKVL